MKARASVRTYLGHVLIPALVLAVLPPSGAAQEAGPLAGLDDYIRGAVDAWGATGLAVAVVKDGEIVFAHGYGVADLRTGDPVDPDTRFAIGSTTKAMTAAALGMLVDEGKLAWDDPVIEHLEGFRLWDPYVTREITIRDLLTHRAGLGNADFLWYEQDATRDEILHRIRLAEPAYSLRSSFIYQNIMYAAAGAVVEAVSGTAWRTFVKQRIFDPLGMTGTVATLAETVGEPNVATPHDRVDGKVVPIENASVDPVDAAGSVWSSVEDMSRWLRFLLAEGVTGEGRRLLEEETVEELFTPQTLVPGPQFYPTAELTRPHWTTYGLGWFQHDYRGRKVDFHTGSIDGMVAIAGLIREQELGVYVLGNRDHVEVRHAIMYRVFDLYGDGPPRDWSAELKELYDGIAARASEARADAHPVEGTSPSVEASALVGTYSDPLYGTVEVRSTPEGLELSFGSRQGPMEHRHYDTYEVRWTARWRGSATATFELGPDGSVRAVTLGRSRFTKEAPGR